MSSLRLKIQKARNISELAVVKAAGVLA